MSEQQPNTESTPEPTLPDLPGVNLQAGLNIARNNRAIYRRLLIKFRDGWSDYRQTFEEALGDNHATGQLAHNLKGVASNLGIDQVQQVAEELELLCRANDSTETRRAEICQRLYQELERVLGGLRTLD